MGKRGPKPRYESAEALRLAKNERRRLARAADPTYRERAAQYQRAYEERVGPKETLRKRAWIKANPLQRRKTRAIRRGRIYSAPGHHTRADAALILQWQGGRCAYCDASSDLHLDHCNPLARGGSNWPWNLQWLCARHNVAKGTMTDAEYRERAGLPPDTPIALGLWQAALVLQLA